MAESSNGKYIQDPNVPSAAASQSPEEGACAEQELILTLHQVESLMDRAVSLSARIGPEWENVVSGVQATLLDSLLELEKRLRPRLVPRGNPGGATAEIRNEGKPDV